MVDRGGAFRGAGSVSPQRAQEALRRTLAAYRRAPLAVRLRARGSVLTRHLVAFEAALPPAGRILDYGAGDGLFSRFLVEASGGRDVVAVEPDPGRLAMAKSLHVQAADGRITFVRALTDVPGERFNAAVILDVLYLIPPPKRENWHGNLAGASSRGPSCC